MRWTTVLLTASWVVAIGTVATLGTVAALGGTLPPSGVENPGYLAGVAAVAAIPLGLGTLLAVRAPGNALSVVFAASGATLPVVLLAVDPDAQWSAGSWMLLYLPIALALLLVPTGRLPSPRWRVVAWCCVGTVAAFNALAVVSEFIAVPDGVSLAAGLVLLTVFAGALLACAAAPIVRYRQADALTRVRLRWVFLAGASVPVTLALCQVSYLALGRPDLVVLGLLAMYIAIPACATIAVLRPTWVDVDRVVVMVLTAAALAVAGLGLLALAASSTEAMPHSTARVVMAAAAATIALGAVAAYRPVNTLIGRRMYRERSRALEALAGLRTRVEAGDTAPESLREVLRAAMRDPGLEIAYLGILDHRLATLEGAAITLGAGGVPVRFLGEEIGAIVPSPSRMKPPAQAIVRRAAPLVAASRLRAELNRATRELSASRQRMLTTSYDERHRLERDLHDGAQQRLVALGIRLRVLQRRAGADDVLRAELDAAVAQLGTAVAELRRLAHGLRPSALDDGLGPALAGLAAASPGMLELDVRIGEVPDAVSTTAYFVASEAVNNALRHADARSIRVQVRHDDGLLTLSVADDGRGGAAPAPGSGLSGLRDRVETLGGRITVTSRAEFGTTVQAVLPCAS